MSVIQRRSRAPDAAQRLLDGALQSRGPCSSECYGLLGPGSAPHRFALRRVRDTRVMYAATPVSVIASAAKQSRIPPRKDSGWLRCARNDDVEMLPRFIVSCAVATSRYD